MSGQVTPERREQLRRAGRKGGMRRWILHPSTPGMFDKAQAAFRRTFLDGHGCAACGEHVSIAHLEGADRRKAAERLRRLHYQNLAARSAEVRRNQ